MGVAGTIAGSLIAFVGYVPNVAQSASTLNGISFIYNIVTAIGFILSLIFILFYDLSKDKYEYILSELNQRKISWGEGLMSLNRNYHIEELTTGVFRIEEFGLGTIYLVKGSKKGLLIDTGTGVADLKGVVEEILDTPYDIVLTHGHMDHVGGIGQFNKIYVHEKDIDMTLNTTLSSRKSYAKSILDTYPTETPNFSIEEI